MVTFVSDWLKLKSGRVNLWTFILRFCTSGNLRGMLDQLTYKLTSTPAERMRRAPEYPSSFPTQLSDYFILKGKKANLRCVHVCVANKVDNPFETNLVIIHVIAVSLSAPMDIHRLCLCMQPPLCPPAPPHPLCAARCPSWAASTRVWLLSQSQHPSASLGQILVNSLVINTFIDIF